MVLSSCRVQPCLAPLPLGTAVAASALRVPRARMLTCLLVVSVARTPLRRMPLSVPITLPFESQDVMVPGETREIRVYDHGLADLLDFADQNFGGLLAQQVLVESCENREEGVPLLCHSWLPLLHITEIRDPWQLSDWTEDDLIVMWAEIRCVGRVIIQGDVAIISANDGCSQTCACVEPYVDGSLSDLQRDATEGLVQEVERLRSACFENEKLLVNGQGGTAEETRWETEKERRLGEITRRAQAQPPVELGRESLEQRAAALEAVLQWQGLDAAPATTLEELYPLWNVCSEQDSSLHLASYAACGWLRPSARTKALATRSTLKRLKLACRELDLVQKMQGAKLALLQLGKEQRRE